MKGLWPLLTSHKRCVRRDAGAIQLRHHRARIALPLVLCVVVEDNVRLDSHPSQPSNARREFGEFTARVVVAQSPRRGRRPQRAHSTKALAAFMA